MDKSIIIFGSKYGTTKSYAQELSKRIGVNSISYREIKSLTSYDTVIYLGGVYVGQILGLSKTLKKYPLNFNQSLIIVAVSLSDSKDATSFERISNSLSKLLPLELFEKCKIFNLQGGLDYQKLNFLYKFMMRAVYKSAKKDTTKNESNGIITMMENPDKKISFVDFKSLNKIEDFIKKLSK